MSDKPEYEGNGTGVMIAIGIVLCFTGIGMIIGIPLVIYGVIEMNRYK